MTFFLSAHMHMHQPPDHTHAYRDSPGAPRRSGFSPPGSALGPWVEKVTIYFPSLAMAPVQENKNVTFPARGPSTLPDGQKAARRGAAPRGSVCHPAARRAAARCAKFFTRSKEVTRGDWYVPANAACGARGH